MKIGYAKFLFRVFVFKLASTFPEYSRWCKAIGWNEEKEMNWMLRRKLVKFEGEFSLKTKIPNLVLMDSDQYSLHSFNDEPAVIRSDRYKAWYKEGELHRDGDEPAVIDSNGRKVWYKEGKRHREGDEPAIIFSDGTKAWYKEGELHRDGDEPAVIDSDGRKVWYKEGKREKRKFNFALRFFLCFFQCFK